MVRDGGGAASTLADRSAALYRPCSYFRVGIADVSRKSEADVRLLRARHAARRGVASMECPGPDSNCLWE
jgi:hypothetical protein